MGVVFDFVEKVELVVDKLEEEIGIRFENIEIFKLKDWVLEKKLELEGEEIKNIII